MLQGTALRSFLNFKENIFGEDQMFTDMQEGSNCGTTDNNPGDLKEDDSSANLPLELREDFDYRNYRSLEVDVSVIMHDIQAHLLKVKIKPQKFNVFLILVLCSIARRRIHLARLF